MRIPDRISEFPTSPPRHPIPPMILDDDDFSLPPPQAAFIPLAATATIVSPPTPQAPPPPINTPTFPTYTTIDYEEACTNKYNRWMPNSPFVSYPVLEVFSNQPTTMLQFSNPVYAQKSPALMPSANAQKPTYVGQTIVPKLMPLTHGVFAHGLPNGTLSLVGYSGDQLMRSRRSYRFTVKEENKPQRKFTFRPCSPTKKGDFLGFGMSVERFIETDEAKQIEESIEVRSKKGRYLELHKADILERDKIVTRIPDQNKTMGPDKPKGHPAVKEFFDTLEKYQHILTNPVKEILKVSSEVCLNDYRDLEEEKLNTLTQDEQHARKAVGVCGQRRTEWLHGESFRHTPMKDNPQRKDNLGAARKCHNTEMMVLEGVAKWFALNVKTAEVTTDFDFKMLLDTEVIDAIHFAVLIKIKQFTIKLTQHIDPFCQYPAFIKASDMAGLIHILLLMVQNIPPISVQPIDVLCKIPAELTQSQSALFSRKRDREEVAPQNQQAVEKQPVQLPRRTILDLSVPSRKREREEIKKEIDDSDEPALQQRRLQ